MAPISAPCRRPCFCRYDWLHPADTATTITLKDGEKRVQDGPFAETQETLGGFFAIDVPDLDAALAGRKMPSSQTRQGRNPRLGDE